MGREGERFFGISGNRATFNIMENYSVVLFILALMIGLSALADKVRLPYPVLLITAGVAIGFIPSLPPPEIHPEVPFLIFLPPLLYHFAFNNPFSPLQHP